MDAIEVLRTYASVCVSENDDIGQSMKTGLLNIIENADDEVLSDLVESGVITMPSYLIEDTRSDAAIIGESVILLNEVEGILGQENLLELDINYAKNRLKDMLGMETDLKYKIGKAVGKAKEALQKQLDAIQDKIPALKDSIAKAAEKVGKGAGEAIEKGKDIVAAAPGAIKKAGETVVKKAGETASDIKQAGGEFYRTDLENLGKVGKAVKGGIKAVSDFSKDKMGSLGMDPGTVTAGGGIAAAAAAITAGIMAYRRFWSKAARACKGSADRKNCLNNYKNRAILAQIAATKAGKAKCAKSKNPKACNAKIDAKIEKLKVKTRESTATEKGT